MKRTSIRHHESNLRWKISLRKLTTSRMLRPCICTILHSIVQILLMNLIIILKIIDRTIKGTIWVMVFHLTTARVICHLQVTKVMYLATIPIKVECLRESVANQKRQDKSHQSFQCPSLGHKNAFLKTILPIWDNKVINQIVGRTHLIIFRQNKRQIKQISHINGPKLSWKIINVLYHKIISIASPIKSHQDQRVINFFKMWN